MQMTH